MSERVLIKMPGTVPDSHVKCRDNSYRHRDYPERFNVPEKFVPWNIDFPEYKPIEFTAPSVLARPVWAHSPVITEVDRNDIKCYAPVAFDANGYPMNPVGRTGIAGRGLLGKWGGNFAADPLITFSNDRDIYFLGIERGDGGGIAIPGGMADKGEALGGTLRRELKEETSAELDEREPVVLYAGYVDDPRNTDNAWMLTMVGHWHLSDVEAASLFLKAGDDARQVKWHKVTPELIRGMYASHGDFLTLAIKSLTDQGDVVAYKLYAILVWTHITA